VEIKMLLHIKYKTGRYQNHAEWWG